MFSVEHFSFYSFDRRLVPAILENECCHLCIVFLKTLEESPHGWILVTADTVPPPPKKKKSSNTDTGYLFLIPRPAWCTFYTCFRNRVEGDEIEFRGQHPDFLVDGHDLCSVKVIQQLIKAIKQGDIIWRKSMSSLTLSNGKKCQSIYHANKSFNFYVFLVSIGQSCVLRLSPGASIQMKEVTLWSHMVTQNGRNCL